tara:strand:+ start:99 stop:311 length:213 start_codon:yes stop_codon:yes gene_type:complete
MTYLRCDLCNKNCPNTSGASKAYFSSKCFGGKFCGVQCVVKFINRESVKRKYVNLKNKNINEIKIVRKRM